MADDPAPEDVPPPPLSVPAELARRRTRLRISLLIRWTLVVPFLVLFAIGLALPGVPQIPFLVAALVLMAPEVPPARRGATWFFRKLPKLRRRVPRRWRRTKDRNP